MSNTLTIWRKELNSYFRSPIAYGVMAFFAIPAGYMFYIGVYYFVRMSVQSSMMGQSQPMSVNDSVIRPLLSNISVLTLFLVPMIAICRLFAEGKAQRCLSTGLHNDLADQGYVAIIMGEMAYGSDDAVRQQCSGRSLLVSMATLFFYGKAGYPADGGGLPEECCSLTGGTFARDLHIRFRPVRKNQIVAGVAGFSVCLMLWVLDWLSSAIRIRPSAKSSPTYRYNPAPLIRSLKGVIPIRAM